MARRLDPLETLADRIGTQYRRTTPGPDLVPVRWASADTPGVTGRISHLPDLPSRRTVVVGDEGAGKSVLAVQFASQRLAVRMPGDPVPVVFPLSAWRGTKDFVRWAAGRLTGLSRVTASELLRTGKVLPVLDGFDEVPEPIRPGLLAQLDALPALLITSRVDVNLAGAAVIRLQPLTVDDLRQYLPAITWDPVLDVLASSPGLREALSSPLMARLARQADPGELLNRWLSTRQDIEDYLLDGAPRPVRRTTRAGRAHYRLVFATAGVTVAAVVAVYLATPDPAPADGPYHAVPAPCALLDSESLAYALPSVSDVVEGTDGCEWKSAGFPRIGVRTSLARPDGRLSAAEVAAGQFPKLDNAVELTGWADQAVERAQYIPSQGWTAVTVAARSGNVVLSIQYLADDIRADTATEIAEILAAHALRQAVGSPPAPRPVSGKKRPSTRTLADVVQADLTGGGFQDRPTRVVTGKTWQQDDETVVFNMAGSLAFRLPLPASCMSLPDTSVEQRWRCYLLIPPPKGLDVLDLVVSRCDSHCEPSGTGWQSRDETTWSKEVLKTQVYELSLHHKASGYLITAWVRVTTENVVLAQKVINDIWTQLGP